MHNWSDTVTFRAARIHRPETVDAVRALVAGAARIRAVGTRHSFNDIADSSGDMIDLGGIASDFVIDRARNTVTAGAGTPYGVLAPYLEAHGFALHNMASLPHISLAGATATGTHGSGDRNGTLSAAVAGLELVKANGDMVHIARESPDFPGMVVGLGAFGVVTRITLDIEPRFQVRQDAFSGLSWDVVLERLDDVMAAGYSVSLMTMWSTPTIGRLWIKTRSEDGGAVAAAAALFGAVPAAPVQSEEAAGTDLLTPFGVVGPWCDRLPHFRLDVEPGIVAQIQSEYMVPRAHAGTAMAELRTMGARIDALLMVSEVRTMAADRLWLSPAYGTEAVAFHFTWRKEIAAVDAITRDIEDLLLPLGGRPHWGKLIHAGAEAAAKLYPELDRFRALAERYDPPGKFRNAFLERHIFGT